MLSGQPPTAIVQITDWLPPEFSAVSQYALLIAEEEARAGSQVTVVGLSSTASSTEIRQVTAGQVRVVAIKRTRYRKSNWAARLAWSLATDAILVARAFPFMRRAEVIRFTGSPPFLLHFVAAINVLLRKRLVYRITDFYPECILAALPRRHRGLELFRAFTNQIRRRVGTFEVIGNDMRARLLECGVPPDRILLRRDDSPVRITSATPPLARPQEAAGKKVLLYSGNWGVAHDVDTFLTAYVRHHRQGSGSVLLWLNATGSGADELDAGLRSSGIPFVRQKLVPLSDLPNLLVTPDAHLITLKPAFVGYVLPSKVYGCIASAKPVLYIGPAASDVHQLCLESSGTDYRRVGVGDVDGVLAALEELGTASSSELRPSSP
jgi:hypothetical protein